MAAPISSKHTLAVYEPPTEPLKIVHEDAHLLVLNKPAGLLSVPGRGEHLADCMASRAIEMFPEALVVHRLDMDTSGIFVMALRKDVQAHIGKQFERRKTQKLYIADVWGMPEQESGLVDLPLRCDWENRPRQMVCHEQGKASQTRWSVIDEHAHGARLRLEPITGRTHQLRVHMMALGHPILGDCFYAHKDARAAASRLHLHAQSLTLHHPESGDLITFEDEVRF